MRLAGDGKEEFFVLLTWAPRLLDTSSGRDAAGPTESGAPWDLNEIGYVGL